MSSRKHRLRPCRPLDKTWKDIGQSPEIWRQRDRVSFNQHMSVSEPYVPDMSWTRNLPAAKVLDCLAWRSKYSRRQIANSARWKRRDWCAKRSALRRSFHVVREPMSIGAAAAIRATWAKPSGNRALIGDNHKVRAYCLNGKCYRARR
jgi:hypothetical protein